jgi:hypothetical protein
VLLAQQKTNFIKKQGRFSVRYHLQINQNLLLNVTISRQSNQKIKKQKSKVTLLNHGNKWLNLSSKLRAVFIEMNINICVF